MSKLSDIQVDMTNAFTTSADALVALVLKRVEEYTKVAGCAESTLSRRALGEAEFIARLRKGENVTIGKIRRLETFLNSELNLAAMRQAGGGELPAAISAHA